MKQIIVQASRDDLLTFILLVNEENFNKILEFGLTDLKVEKRSHISGISPINKEGAECVSLYVSIESRSAGYSGGSEVHYLTKDLTERQLNRVLKYRKSGCKIISAGNFNN